MKNIHLLILGLIVLFFALHTLGYTEARKSRSAESMNVNTNGMLEINEANNVRAKSGTQPFVTITNNLNTEQTVTVRLTSSNGLEFDDNLYEHVYLSSDESHTLYVETKGAYSGNADYTISSEVNGVFFTKERMSIQVKEPLCETEGDEDDESEDDMDCDRDDEEEEEEND